MFLVTRKKVLCCYCLIVIASDVGRRAIHSQWIKYRPEYEPSGPMSLQGHSRTARTSKFFYALPNNLEEKLEVGSRKVEVRSRKLEMRSKKTGSA